MTIIYTWAKNLLKKDDMATGSVSFKDDKKVVHIPIEKDKEIIKRVSKTKKEEHPDLKSKLVVLLSLDLFCLNFCLILL